MMCRVQLHSVVTPKLKVTLQMYEEITFRFHFIRYYLESFKMYARHPSFSFKSGMVIGQGIYFSHVHWGFSCPSDCLVYLVLAFIMLRFPLGKQSTVQSLCNTSSHILTLTETVFFFKYFKYIDYQYLTILFTKKNKHIFCQFLNKVMYRHLNLHITNSQNVRMALFQKMYLFYSRLLNIRCDVYFSCTNVSYKMEQENSVLKQKTFLSLRR